VISAPQIDAVYASFENGIHRVVTRVDDDRRRSDARIPANARWHMSFIDDSSAGADRKRHRTFYETWPTPISRYSISAANNDLRMTVPQSSVRETLDGQPWTEANTDVPRHPSLSARRGDWKIPAGGGGFSFLEQC